MFSKQRIQHYLYDMFDIRDGEGVRGLCMLLYIFLVISSIMIVKPVKQRSLPFLVRSGQAALRLYRRGAFFTAVITSVYPRLMARYSLPDMIRFTLIVFGIFLSVFWVLCRRNVLSGPSVFVLYVVIANFAVLSASQFWSFANVVFNPREAKRLFGFIGSGAIIGGIFGGYLTNLLAPVLGSENILLISIAFIMMCLCPRSPCCVEPQTGHTP